MKQLFLSLMMLLCVGSTFGQTADKLMAKWKAIDDAEYSETTVETRKSIEESFWKRSHDRIKAYHGTWCRQKCQCDSSSEIYKFP